MMTYLVRMTYEADAEHYMVEVLNTDTIECELTEYFPAGDARGRAFANAKARSLELREEYSAEAV